MKQYWVCNSCRRPCLLVFWENHNFKGTNCCMALAHTERVKGPFQGVLL